jgi:antitoxin component YwqK of YwqJK toxin-antitoxin module
VSDINGVDADIWIEENHPENGLFKVYWKDVVNPHSGGASFKDEGEGLRYEWYYEDGKVVDGVTKSWFPDGQKKSEVTYKDGIKDGLWTELYENGQKKREVIYKDGELINELLWTKDNGQKSSEGIIKGQDESGNIIKDGLYTEWFENGQKKLEGTFKDGERDGLYTSWNENGKKWFEEYYKDGELINQGEQNEK